MEVSSKILARQKTRVTMGGYGFMSAVLDADVLAGCFAGPCLPETVHAAPFCHIL